MKKKVLKWAAISAALIAAIFGVIFLMNQYDDDPINGEIISETETSYTKRAVPAADGSAAVPETTEQGNGTDAGEKIVKSTQERSPSLAFTLTICGKDVQVYDSVDESSLTNHPGHLPSSVMSGEDGMCVVYGHRNRTHLRVLEKVSKGDEILVTMPDGSRFTYTILDLQTYEHTEDMRLPLMDGKSLVLVTCWPFRYSGHAPGKYIVMSVEK